MKLSKVIWLRCGNTSTSNIETILRSNYDTIEDFILNLEEICLELY
jgi:predicted nuclease of predicted toxin-antitoxin system